MVKFRPNFRPKSRPRSGRFETTAVEVGAVDFWRPTANTSTHTIIVTINSSKVMYIHSAGLRHLNDDRSNSSICLLNIDIFQAKTCMDFYGSVFISKSREVLVWDSLWSDLILDRQKFDWIWHITPTYNLCHGSKNVNFVNDKCYFHSSHCFRFELTYFD